MSDKEVDRFEAMYEEFLSIMELYKAKKDRDSDTMAYFRAINDNLNTLNKRLWIKQEHTI